MFGKYKFTSDYRFYRLEIFEQKDQKRLLRVAFNEKRFTCQKSQEKKFQELQLIVERRN